MFTHWFVGRLIDRSVDLIDWLVGSLSWLVGWLVGGSVFVGGVYGRTDGFGDDPPKHARTPGCGQRAGDRGESQFIQTPRGMRSNGGHWVRVGGKGGRSGVGVGWDSLGGLGGL